MPSELTVRISGSASERTLTFSESPVRIGRNQLNDISLDDPFVSEWHGTIRFDEGAVFYTDLGSTNGSVLAGSRLAKNVPTSLTDKSGIWLGRIELAVSIRSSKETGPRKTIAWGHSRGADRAAGEGPALHPTLERNKSSTSAPTPLPGKEESKGNKQALLRQRQILEAFSEAFVGLRKGYEQFGAEVGVRTINGRSMLNRSRTGQSVLDHLLQSDVDVATVKRDLNAVFADFGIHHIAMMGAITEGVRALLGSLDPRANELDVAGKLFSASRSKQKWNAYLERFDQLLTEDQELHAAIFGPEFVRAYARATLGDGSKQDEPKVK